MQIKYNALINQIASELSPTTAEPFLEAEILLLYCTKRDKTWLTLNRNKTVPTGIYMRIKALVSRRVQGEPLAHIMKSRFFYENEFYVNKYCLIPRQETEVLVDLLITKIEERLQNNNAIHLLEIGTGSGCIPISIIHKMISKNLYPDTSLYFTLTDISPKALCVAKENFKRILPHFTQNDKWPNIYKYQEELLTVQITFVEADIISNISKSTKIHESATFPCFDIIFSNPPYIPDHLMASLPPDVKNEPTIALAGGKDGTEIITRIFNETKGVNKKGTQYILEIHPDTKSLLRTKILKQLKLRNMLFIKDLNGQDRFLCVENT